LATSNRVLGLGSAQWLFRLRLEKRRAQQLHAAIFALQRLGYRVLLPLDAPTRVLGAARLRRGLPQRRARARR
jgi:hypothetical protein